MGIIDKKTLEYLAELGRIELAESEKEKLLKDLQEILGHFQELQKIDTTDAEPMSGGGLSKDVSRPDEISDRQLKLNDNLIQAFPEKENNFLKVPPVFE